MPKRLFAIVVPVGIAIIVAALLWLRWPHSAAKPPPVAATKTAPEQPLADVNGPLLALVPTAAKPHRGAATQAEAEPPPTGATGPSATPAPEASTLKDRILVNATQYADPAAMAALLKELYREDPNGLFDTLVALGQGAGETRRSVWPLLAEALTLWPEAEARYVFPIADAYAAIDLPAAAEWGASFLVKTGRADLAVSTLLGRLSEVSETRALALIATLPEASRLDAIDSVARHIPLGDLNHLMQVGAALDPLGTSTFSPQLFDRLGVARLGETAAWLATTPEAERIPGAVAAISQALVRYDDPQKAIAWADALPDRNARAQAIAAVYQAWAQNSPASAIQDILAAYDGTPQLMADVFQGAAEHHGSGAAAQWELASRLENPSARAYAISALVEPLLITVGPAETRAKIAALPSDSLERNVAELMLQTAYKNPATVRQIEVRNPAAPL